MSGVPVVVVPKGGIPVRGVDSGAPVMTIADNGMGVPITYSNNGTPFVVRGQSWTPERLFNGGQPGFWAGGFAPTSLRLFQDAAGTTPANQAGQPIGKVARAAGTVDATQDAALSRPTLARWPKGGRRNLAVRTGVSVAPSIEVTDGFPDPNGGNDAVKVVFSSGSLTMGLTAAVVFAEPQMVSSRFYVKGASGQTIRFKPYGNNAEANLSLTGEWQEVSRPGVLGTSGSFNINTWVGVTAREIYLYAPQCEMGPELSAYQRVVSDFDVTETGVPDVWHLWNDGGDSLPAILSAGAYEIAWVTPLGAVSYASVTSDGTTGTDLLRAERMADVLVREGAFTSAEKTDLEFYWHQRYAA